MNDQILIVEDEPADATLLKRALNKADPSIKIEVVPDGEDALALLSPDQDKHRSAWPTCILLDLKLRKMDGHALLMALKDDERTRKIPVVILTSSSDPADVKLAYDLGANSYLIKPVESRELGRISDLLVGYWLNTNHFPREDNAI